MLCDDVEELVREGRGELPAFTERPCSVSTTGIEVGFSAVSS